MIQQLAASTLSSSNVTVTADGVRLTNLSFGTVTTSADSKTKTFPLTINNFPGGDIKITISAGALKDASGNSSAQKVYEFSSRWSSTNLGCKHQQCSI